MAANNRFDKFKKEAEKLGTEVARGIKDATTGVERRVSDFVKPPSTVEQAERFLSDTFTDLRREAEDLSRQIKPAFISFIDQADKFLKEHAGDPAPKIAEFFTSLSKSVKGAMISPVLTNLKEFFKDIGGMFVSIAGSEQDRTKAFGRLADSASALKTAVITAVTPNKGQSIL